MKKEHRIALLVALLTLLAIVLVTVFRSGTAW